MQNPYESIDKIVLEKYNGGIEIYPNTKIYVACPANVITGGPESLHQLAFHLRSDLNIETFIYYYKFDNNKFESPTSPEYLIYKIPYLVNINNIEDNEENILIVPEVIEGLELLAKFSNIRRGVWFLSVDNYYVSRLKKIKFFRKVHEFKSYLNIEFMTKNYNYKKDKFLMLADFYMINTYRGINNFNQLKPIYYLCGYINESFLECSFNTHNKENIVAYNPVKGGIFTNKIIQALSNENISFIPIANMKREQVIETLKRSKVYIDFGNHPGKDRIPREAAMNGCCVIACKRGSAKYFEDVPTPDEYKFEDKDENISNIISKVKDCIYNYNEKYKDFDYYREYIKKEPIRFIEDLRKIFIKKDYNEIQDDIVRFSMQNPYEGIKTAIIYGAGIGGERTYNHLIEHGIEVIAFIDDFKEGEYLGKPIVKLEDLDKYKADGYFVGTAYSIERIESYTNRLKEIGIPEDKIFISLVIPLT